MTLRLLGISGSLRKGSYNTAALRAARELAPEGVSLELFDLASIPMYNDGVRAITGVFPRMIAGLRHPAVGILLALLFFQQAVFGAYQTRRERSSSANRTAARVLRQHRAA